MKRVVRSKSGREMYGPKWLNNHNMESSSSTSDALHSPISVQTTELAPVSDAAAAPLPVTQTNGVANQDQTSQGVNRRRIRLSNRHETMYRATLEGDCGAVEMLLEEDPNLGGDEITEEGDRALHVAASMKHQEMVRMLIQIMSPSDLALLDGHGYTACCHAAISGSLEIAGLMIRKNPTIATARDRENKTPLQKAALRGNMKMASFFLKSTIITHLLKDEWFDLLLVTIRGKMYGVALQILGIDEQLATMTNDEGTAFHLLAREKRFYTKEWQKKKGEMRQDMRLLAKKLWTCIQRLGEVASVQELMKNPSILHNAAEVGNVELITMLTHTYPDLVWQTNTQGYTIFHIAVKHRQACLFGLINEIGTRKDFIAMSRDENGNNILHLAAELGPLDVYITPMPPFRMQWEKLWFEEVKAIVPPVCLKMKNKDGHTPRELYGKEHLSLLKESITWMRNTSDSCMLISTLLFGVVFASTFAIPGGYNQNTGIPILFGTRWFTVFVICEAVAMFLAAWSIIRFWRIMTMCSDHNFFTPPLSAGLFLTGLGGLFYSMFCVIIAFTSAYFLVYIQNFGLVAIVISSVNLVLAYTVGCQLLMLSRYTRPDTLFRKSGHTLFKRHAAVRKNKCTSWIF